MCSWVTAAHITAAQVDAHASCHLVVLHHQPAAASMTALGIRLLSPLNCTLHYMLQLQQSLL